MVRDDGRRPGLFSNENQGRRPSNGMSVCGSSCGKPAFPGRWRCRPVLLVPHHFAGALPKSRAEPDQEHSLSQKERISDPLGLHEPDPRPERCSREGPCDQADPQEDPEQRRGVYQREPKGMRERARGRVSTTQTNLRYRMTSSEELGFRTRLGKAQEYTTPNKPRNSSPKRRFVPGLPPGG